MSRSETPLAIAERHVREAEQRIARLAALTEGWEKDGHQQASEQARSALIVAAPELEVARDRLRTERFKSGIAQQPQPARHRAS